VVKKEPTNGAGDGGRGEINNEDFSDLMLRVMPLLGDPVALEKWSVRDRLKCHTSVLISMPPGLAC
jgi:hypothetical protein